MKFEYKYIVPTEILSELRTLIDSFVEFDIHMKMGGPSGYTVRSIYFDTPQYNDYYETIHGLTVRKKIRIRGYNEQNQNSIVFLEIKRKNEKRVKKYRAPVKYQHLKDLLATGNTMQYILTDYGIKNALENSRRFLFHIYKSLLQPMVIIIYEREAFFSKYDPSLRITFDKNLRSIINPDINILFKEKNIKYTLTKHFILEVKFYDIIPSWLSSILNLLDIKLQSFSKYVTCIDDYNVVNNSSRQNRFNWSRAVHF